MGGLPDPAWYFENVLAYAQPGRYDTESHLPAARWQAWWRRQTLGADRVLEVASRQGFVLTTDQLLAAGWTTNDVRRERRRGRWSTPARGAISPIVVPLKPPHLAARRRHALASAAAWLQRPGQVVSGRSGAILHGLPTLAVPPLAELTARDDTSEGRRAAAHLYGATLPDDHVTSWFGVDVTTVARTVVDLARHNRRDGLMAADAALREQLTSPSELNNVVKLASGWPGVRAAREIVALASPQAESALESITRLALFDDGFPAPSLQVKIDDPRRGKTYRVDMLWPEKRLILEIDGRIKYTDDELWREKRREARLRALGFIVERIVWADVMVDWPETSARLRALLGGGPTGFPAAPVTWTT